MKRKHYYIKSENEEKIFYKGKWKKVRKEKGTKCNVNLYF